MLTRLTISNIVLIDQAVIEFGEGLCVLTGETGAGKSILLDALGLALGGRSEARLVRTGAEKAQVVAEFSLADASVLAPALEELGIEAEDHLIIRRQLGADGKSRAYLNDVAVSAKALREIGEQLVEIHGQHQQRGLLDAATHGALLDAYGGHGALLERVASDYAVWRDARKAREALLAEIEKTAREKEYLEHMRAELKALNPHPGEETELSDRRARMMQGEKMATTLDEVIADLEQPKNVYDALRGAQATLLRSTLKDAEKFTPAIEALERAMLEVEAAREVVMELGRSCEFDPHELERVEERLFALKAAGRKYNLPLDELPDLFAQTKEKLEMLAQQEAHLATLEEEVATARDAYIASAGKLSEARGKTAKKLVVAVHKELAPLKMEATRFDVMLTLREEGGWNALGVEKIEFMVATNKGSQTGPLATVASGGELSRFMLALAVVLGEAKATPVMIFDEIDTGTGGAVADAIGRRLEALGNVAQVLVVTHLPQVAARGAQHLVVEKEEKKGTTITSVRALSAAQKEEELARMLSGAEISDKAREAARHLMEAAG